MRRCIRERGSTNERGYERERESDVSDWVCVCEFYENLEEP